MLPKVVKHNGAHELFMLTYVVVVGQRYYWRAREASETLSGVYKFELMRYVYIYIYLYLLVMCSVSTNGERASLVNLKLTIGSLLECS